MPEDQPGFLKELQQRKVFRVAAAYLVFAWVALQFFDLVLDNLDAPAWLMQALMALLAIGFPVSLVLAWAFDLFPEGPRAVPGRSPAFALLVAVVSAAALGYVAWSYLGPATGDAPAGAAADPAALRTIDSIAVLPFESFSADPQDGFFADGLADTLLHKLAQVETLKVIARNSSFQYKGSNLDAREIGRTLGVAALVEGSVQRQEDRIRIIAQLIDTASGSHIWSGTFDDSLQNIFELQDRVAQAIMEQLRVSISERDRLLTLRNGTDSPQAFERLVLARGVPWEDDRVSFDPATDRALALIDQALQIDPDYAQAWALRSQRFTSALFLEGDTARSAEYIEEAHHAAEKAIESDPDFEGGYVTLGWSHFRAKRFTDAERSFHRALELAPRSPDAMRALGLIKVSDDPQSALTLFMQARDLDPQSDFIYRQMFFALDALGRLDEGLQLLLQGLARFPDNVILMSDVAGVQLYDMGRPDEAARWASRIVAQDNQSLIGSNTMAAAWAAVGDADRSAGWLALHAARFAGAWSVQLRRAFVETLRGNVQEARAIVESVPESPNFRFDRATPIGGACLVLADKRCLVEQAEKMAGWLAQYEADGRSFGPSERYRLAIAILRNAAIDKAADRDVKTLEALSESSQGWPVTGGRGTRYAGYLRAMLLSLLEDDVAAVAELARTLEFANDGYLFRDIFGLPPDHNPLVTRLAGTPGYDAWLADLAGRRDRARQRLLQMEGDGEILAVADVTP